MPRRKKPAAVPIEGPIPCTPLTAAQAQALVETEPEYVRPAGDILAAGAIPPSRTFPEIARAGKARGSTTAATINRGLAVRRADRLIRTSREAWLTRATELARPVFDSLALPLPDVRVSVGPLRFTSKGSLAGCCYPTAASDKVPEVVVSLWHRAEAVDVFGTLVHELIHAAGVRNHYGRFQRRAQSLGLVTASGKWLDAGWDGLKVDALPPWAQSALETLGAWPVGQVNPVMKPKQRTRMIKVSCVQCDIVWRTVAKNLPPMCCPDAAARRKSSRFTGQRNRNRRKVSNRKGVEPASTLPPEWDGPRCPTCARPYFGGHRRPFRCALCDPATWSEWMRKWRLMLHRHPLDPAHVRPFDPSAAFGQKGD